MILQMSWSQDNTDPQHHIWKRYTRLAQELRILPRTLMILDMSWSQENKDTKEHIWQRYTKVTQELRMLPRNLRVLEMAWSQDIKDISQGPYDPSNVKIKPQNGFTKWDFAYSAYDGRPGFRSQNFFILVLPYIKAREGGGWSQGQKQNFSHFVILFSPIFCYML